MRDCYLSLFYIQRSRPISPAHMQLYLGEEENLFFFFTAGNLPPLEINPRERSIQSKKSKKEQKAFSQKGATPSPSWENEMSLKKKHHFGWSECPEPDGTSSQGKQILPKHPHQAQTGSLSFYPLIKKLQTSFRWSFRFFKKQHN